MSLVRIKTVLLSALVAERVSVILESNPRTRTALTQGFSFQSKNKNCMEYVYVLIAYILFVFQEIVWLLFSKARTDVTLCERRWMGTPLHRLFLQRAMACKQAILLSCYSPFVVLLH